LRTKMAATSARWAPEQHAHTDLRQWRPPLRSKEESMTSVRNTLSRNARILEIQVKLSLLNADANCANCPTGDTSRVQRSKLIGNGARVGSIVHILFVVFIQSYEAADAAIDALLRDGPLGIPRDLPQMAIRVLKITCVSAPENVPRWFHDDSPRFSCLLHHGINFGF
jgi:hypothetical protein